MHFKSLLFYLQLYIVIICIDLLIITIILDNSILLQQLYPNINKSFYFVSANVIVVSS